MNQRDSLALILALEVLPAALFAVSAGFALSTAAAQPLEFAAPSGAAAFLLAWAALRRVGKVDAPLELPHFELDALDASDLAAPANDEGPVQTTTESAGELLLEDVLAGVPSDSRVVRLFQPTAIPTAGELQARIDLHLRSGTRAVAPPDASHELHEALDALRRSLR